jgi:two-component system sensor histidine kinase BarA
MAFTRFKPDTPSTAVETTEKILYVEDEDTNWEVTEFALRDRFKLVRAKDDREVFALLAAEKYDLILMDIQLSGSRLSGIEITQILKGNYTKEIPEFAVGITAHDTPIIFVTAYTARYKKDDLLKAGGDDLIAKPVDFVRLSLSMARLMVRTL